MEIIERTARIVREPETKIEISPEEVLGFYQYLADNDFSFLIHATPETNLTSINQHGIRPSGRTHSTDGVFHARAISPQLVSFHREALQRGDWQVLLEDLVGVINGAIWGSGLAVFFEHFQDPRIVDSTNKALVILGDRARWDWARGLPEYHSPALRINGYVPSERVFTTQIPSDPNLFNGMLRQVLSLRANS